MDFENHVFLKKKLSDFDEEHPLLVNLELSPKVMDYVEELLKKLEETPNFATKIDDMKNPSNWESIFSELKFARKVIALNPEFIKEEEFSRTPDIKVSLLNRDIFFEVKMLSDSIEILHIRAEIQKIKSNLKVYVHFNWDYKDNKRQADELVKYIKDKVKFNSVGTFTFEGNSIRIDRKVMSKTKRTPFSYCQSRGKVLSEDLRKKIRGKFHDKVSQFESRKPIFWVIDCEEWGYDITDFKKAFYGDKICTRKTILELFNEHYFDPECSFLDNKGIFTLDKTECLSGVIVMTEGDMYLLINPLAKQQLDTDSMRQLRKALEHEES